MLTSPDNTRLVTIVAHVDHGKTTLADNLIQSNNIISERLAGKLRYLDSTPEEQRRGITMRSSAIALQHTYHAPHGVASSSAAAATSSPSAEANSKEMIIHIIDSPGHVDFATEVSSSLIACDGALLLVDAVEGMCARTHSVLREAYTHQLIPILVINKIDRLCGELHLSCNEAYVRIRKLIESVNAASAAMILNARAGMEDSKSEVVGDAVQVGLNDVVDMKLGTGGKSRQEDKSNKEHVEDDEDDTESAAWNFDPVKGNVIFTSALHGWGFTIPTLARSLYRSKIIPIRPPQLRQYLYGDFRYNAKSEKIVKSKFAGGGGDTERGSKIDVQNMSLFAEFALYPIWEIYRGINEASSSHGTLSIVSNTLGKGNTHANSEQQEKNDKLSKNYPSSKERISKMTPIMQNVLSILQTCHTNFGNDDKSKVEKLPSSATTMGLPHTIEELNVILSKFTNLSSAESVYCAILRRYRPLSNAVLDAICSICPSPREATTSVRTRALALREPSSSSSFPGSNSHNPNFDWIRRAVKKCEYDVDNDDTPTVGYVCKFISVRRSDITDPQGMANTSRQHSGQKGSDGKSSEGGEVLMAMVRVLSGAIKSNAEVSYEIYGPKYDGNGMVIKRKVTPYLIMGASLLRASIIPAGHICAVSNLDDVQLKTMTLCDREGGMPLRGFENACRPLLKVNVEVVKASETDILERGLLKLSLADAAVEVVATAKGERLLACQGELHMEQCIHDLRELYCEMPINLRISDPIVDFGESTDWFDLESDYETFLSSRISNPRQTSIPPYCDEEGLCNAKLGRCRSIVSGRSAAISVRVVPLPATIYECIKSEKVVDGSDSDLRTFAIALGFDIFEPQSLNSSLKIMQTLMKRNLSLDGNGNGIMEGHGVAIGTNVKGVLSMKGEIFMPSKESTSVGSNDTRPYCDRNVAIDDGGEGTGVHEYISLIKSIRYGLTDSYEGLTEDAFSADAAARELWTSDMRGAAVAGFHLAMRAGPLCEEPIKCVMVVLEGVEVAVSLKPDKEINSDGQSYNAHTVAKIISGGMIVSALRQGIRCALLTRPQRLVEGYVRLTLHSSLSTLGALYAVLSKRRGKVLMDEMVEGTDLILITASLPQSESFGMVQELLTRSSGEISAPELVFSHFKMLNEDPFWIPTSEEEREDFGEIIMNGDSSTGITNNALKILRGVRQRKGLVVDSAKIVVAAEKQRTLARKK